jgi:hypothetical protein
MPQHNTRRGGKGCVLVGLLVLGILLLVPAFSLIVWKRRAADRLATQINRLREAGLPTTGAEVNRYYAIEPGATDSTSHWLDGAVPLTLPEFTEAAKGLPIVSTSDAIPPPGQAWEKLAKAEQLVDQYAAQLERLHQAAAMDGQARYPVDLSRGPETIVSHVQHLRQAARVLALDAHVRAHRGDVEGAVHSMTTIAALADSLDREPIMVSQLVRVAIESIAVNTMAELTPYLQLNDSQWQRLADSLREDEQPADSLQRTIAGEQAMGLVAFNQLDETTGLGMISRDDDRAYYLESMQRLSEACELPPRQAMHAAQQIQQDIADTVGNSPISRLRYTLTSMAMPASDNFVGAVFDSQARRRVGQTLLAIHRYRQQRGAWPPSLDQLVADYLPQLPLDPYTGKPLLYRVEGNGYVLYSVGKNGMDDGRNEQHGLDVVIRVQVDDASNR